MLSPERLSFAMSISKGFEINYYHLLHRFPAPDFLYAFVPLVKTMYSCTSSFESFSVTELGVPW